MSKISSHKDTSSVSSRSSNSSDNNSVAPTSNPPKNSNFQDTVVTTSPPTSSTSHPIRDYLNSLDDINKVKAIGELSTFNQILNSFTNKQVSQYDPTTPPPEKTELLKRWEKEFHSAWSVPEAAELARHQIDSKISSTEIELRKNHELNQISSSKSAWLTQLNDARQSGDAEAILHWEELGKGVFFPKQEEERQINLNKRHQFIHNYRTQLNDSPSKALELLSDENPDSSCLPTTVKNYLTGHAKKLIAQRQETFAHSLIENQLQGTPLAEDALKLAIEKQYITPEHAYIYQENFSSERPLKNDPSLRLPLLTQTRNLIDSYSSDNDLRGERKRSILSLIAAGDYAPAERKSLLRQLDDQLNNPAVATLKNTAHTYLTQCYEKNALGTTSDKSGFTRDKWIRSQEKLEAAQKAISNYLDTRKDSPPSQEDWQKELPRIIYNATRERKRINISDMPMIGGYPISDNSGQNSSNDITNSDESSKASELPHISTSWAETLNSFFSVQRGRKPTQVNEELSLLFQNWLKNRHSTIDSTSNKLFGQLNESILSDKK